MTLFDIGDKKDYHVYLIAGKKEVFLLGEDSTEWAHKLTDQELETFPIEIYWTGPKTNFEVSSRKATELSKYNEWTESNLRLSNANYID